MKLEALLCTHVADLFFCHDGQEGKKAIEGLLGRFFGREDRGDVLPLLRTSLHAE